MTCLPSDNGWTWEGSLREDGVTGDAVRRNNLVDYLQHRDWTDGVRGESMLSQETQEEGWPPECGVIHDALYSEGRELCEEVAKRRGWPTIYVSLTDG